MGKYREALKPFLKEVEGYSSTIYPDAKGNPTVGYGFNLNSPEVVSTLNAHGYDLEKIQKEGLPEEVADKIKDSILDREENSFKNSITPEKFESLSDNEKSALMSMQYNSPGLIGPNMRGYLGADDKINVAREILLNSNKKPG